MLPQGRTQDQQGGNDLLWEAFGHLAGCAAPSYPHPPAPSSLNPVRVTILLQEQEALESVGAQQTLTMTAPGRRLYGPEGATLSSVAQGSMRILEGSLMVGAPRRATVT